MANSKISALTSATTPLAGTETLPIVQSSTTKQVSVANLTAGRNVSVSKLTVSGSGTIEQNGAAGGLYFSNIATAAGATNQRFYTTNASGATQLQLALFGGATPVNSIYGNLNIETGNVVQGTAAKGINFTANTPAAGMTSQLLNWYEEGTWTPVLRFGGGTTGITYTTQQGRYTRIGRTVTIRFEITLSSKGSSTGEADITGLPFSAANLNAMSVYLYSNFLLTYKVGIAYCNGSTINEIAANGTAAFTDVQFTNTSRFWATCTYQV